MIEALSQRKAIMSDLQVVVSMLLEDELGKIREFSSERLDKSYIAAFKKIDQDSNQYLMIVERGQEIVGTCHLTIMHSLTFKGSTRMQIEAVRVIEKYRGQKIGQWMIQAAINYGKSKKASIIQLTTNKNRIKSQKFYEDLGFKPTHEGMKLYL